MILNTLPQAGAYRSYTKFVITMYLLLFDVDNSATLSRASEVFHDGVDVTGLRASREEKVRRRMSDREDPSERGLLEKRTRQKLNPWLLCHVKR